MLFPPKHPVCNTGSISSNTYYVGDKNTIKWTQQSENHIPILSMCPYTFLYHSGAYCRTTLTESGNSLVLSYGWGTLMRAPPYRLLSTWLSVPSQSTISYAGCGTSSWIVLKVTKEKPWMGQ